MTSPLRKILDRLEDVKQSGEQYQARCPAHEDRKASLSLKTGDDGSAVLNCFSGCPPEDVLEAIGLKLADLYAEKPKLAKPTTVAVYDYCNPDGTVRFQVERKSDKTFWQRRPNGKGGVRYGLRDNPKKKHPFPVPAVRPIPYGLPELAAAPDAPVFVVEGEKDVATIRKLGMVATCNPGGASRNTGRPKWLDEYSKWLKGRDVVVLPDNDDPGRAHAEAVARSTSKVAKSVKVLELPGLAEKGDVTDWVAAGGTAEQLVDQVEAASPWKLVEQPAVGFANTTDLGNAERFIAQHGSNVRWWPQRGKWLVWDSRRWQVDEAGKATELAKQTVKSIYEEVKQAKGRTVLIGGEPAKEATKQLRSHARASQGANRMRAMLSLARSANVVFEHQLDADPWLLNVENGTLDLRTGKLRPHRQEDYCTRLAPAAFDEDAQAPCWEAFLDQVIGDQELKTFLQRSIGYALTGTVSEQCLWFLFGTGANGKSTFLNAIRELLGPGLAKQLDFGDLEAKNIDAHPTRFARLVGARWVTATEAEGGKRLAEVVIKQLTGGDPMTARFMRQDFFEFLPQFKLWIAGNHKPTIRGTDEGIWRRIKLVPFEVFIPPEERDGELDSKLKAELPGILTWAVKGCLDWQREGLHEPQAVQDATAAYRGEMDVLGEFVSACCVTGNGYRAGSTELYRAYQDWCEASGERAWTHKVFSLRLRERGFESFKGHYGRCWYDIGVVTNREEPHERQLHVVADQESSDDDQPGGLY